MQRLLTNGRVYRAASAVAHGARVFVSSVFLALVLVHINEGATIAPLALASAAFIVTPAAYEAVRARR